MRTGSVISFWHSKYPRLPICVLIYIQLIDLCRLPIVSPISGYRSLPPLCCTVHIYIPFLLFSIIPPNIWLDVHYLLVDRLNLCCRIRWTHFAGRSYVQKTESNLSKNGKAQNSANKKRARLLGKVDFSFQTLILGHHGVTYFGDLIWGLPYV